MSHSVLLQLARDSIAEVFEAKRTIQKKQLLEEYPLLNEKVSLEIILYLNGKIRGKSNIEQNSLLESIILNAKKAAFEDPNFSTLTVSQYLSCELEITLITPEGTMSEKDISLIESYEKTS